MRTASPTKKQVAKQKQYKKIIQNYTISYCEKQFLGRSLYGQVRVGYETSQKRVRAFRITPLPLSQQSRTNLQLQKYYSALPQQCCTVYQSIQSQTNRYTVMQYFPKTFKTELQSFRKLTKNMQPYINKFLQTYSKLYYYRIAHGNLSLENIGITFDGKVKLMDFRNSQKIGFEQASKKDYRDFRNLMCYVMERDKVFPSKLEVFDDADGDWVKLFSVWHIVDPYQYLYREKKQPIQNMVVLLYKLQSSVYPSQKQEQSQITKQKPQNPCILNRELSSQTLRISLRLLILSHLKKIVQSNSANSKKAQFQYERLYKLLSSQFKDTSFYNSYLWGVMTDCQYYQVSQMQRLTLIICLLPFINHQYYYMDIVKEFQPNETNNQVFKLYADSLMKNYATVAKEYLISL